jgi:hypothetical protein
MTPDFNDYAEAIRLYLKTILKAGILEEASFAIVGEKLIVHFRLEDGPGEFVFDLSELEYLFPDPWSRDGDWWKQL